MSLIVFGTDCPRLRQNGHNFTDIFKCIFLNENVWNSIKISLKFVPMGPNNNIPLLVQIMAWCWHCDKPLCEPMMVRLQMHISRVSCQKGPTRHAYAWQIGPFWQDTLDMWCITLRHQDPGICLHVINTSSCSLVPAGCSWCSVHHGSILQIAGEIAPGGNTNELEKIYQNWAQPQYKVADRKRLFCSATLY